MNSEVSGQRWVFGLCAQWCGVCRDWRTAFDSVAARHPDDRFVWIDVEDQDELVGDVDIETFPTLLVGTTRQVLFFGTILPAPELLSRLLASLDGSSHAGPTPDAQLLLDRLVTAQL